MANVMSVKFGQEAILRALGTDGECEHVEHDCTTAYAVFCEDDSFGPVGRYVVCKDCYLKEKQEEDERIDYCQDCGKALPQKELRVWRWYDFYAAQGDEPLVICDECWKAPKHQWRLQKDEEARKWAAGLGGDPWDWDEEQAEMDDDVFSQICEDDGSL